jgi:hypothetical protein
MIKKYICQPNANTKASSLFILTAFKPLATANSNAPTCPGSAGIKPENMANNCAIKLSKSDKFI